MMIDIETIYKNEFERKVAVLRKNLWPIDKEDVKDSVQESFIEILSTGVAQKVNDLGAFWYVLARYRCIDKLRRSAKYEIGWDWSRQASSDEEEEEARNDKATGMEELLYKINDPKDREYIRMMSRGCVPSAVIRRLGVTDLRERFDRIANQLREERGVSYKRTITTWGNRFHLNVDSEIWKDYTGKGEGEAKNYTAGGIDIIGKDGTRYHAKSGKNAAQYIARQVGTTEDGAWSSVRYALKHNTTARGYRLEVCERKEGE